MSCVMTNVKRFLQDESGATAIEYGLIAALLALTIIGSLATFGTSLGNLFGSNQGGVGSAIEGSLSKNL